MEKEIVRFENKMKNCQSMTDLLLIMSSWQNFCQRNDLSEAERQRVDEAYLEAEKRLIIHVKKSIW